MHYVAVIVVHFWGYQRSRYRDTKRANPPRGIHEVVAGAESTSRRDLISAVGVRGVRCSSPVVFTRASIFIAVKNVKPSTAGSALQAQLCGRDECYSCNESFCSPAICAIARNRQRCPVKRGNMVLAPSAKEACLAGIIRCSIGAMLCGIPTCSLCCVQPLVNVGINISVVSETPSVTVAVARLCGVISLIA